LALPITASRLVWFWLIALELLL